MAVKNQNGPEGGFAGRTVLSFESRRSAEIATLIENCDGRAMVAPATREVPAASSADVARFASALLEGKIDLVIFLTGVGTRALARAIEPFCSREQFISVLSKVPVLARGPKPIAALKELGVPILWNVPEPNTWREILQVLDVNNVQVAGRLVAVQEYGVPSKDLLSGLQRARRRRPPGSRLRLGSTGRRHAAAKRNHRVAGGESGCGSVHGGHPGASPAASGRSSRFKGFSACGSQQNKNRVDRSGDF